MKILITGACGFIGSHLAEQLHDLGHLVSGVDNLETGSLDNWRIANSAIFSITDREKLYQLANRVEPDLVIHCAASYKDPNKWHVDTDVNVAGSINAALVAKHHGAQLVYFQTVLPPLSSYAISKIAGEQYIRLSGVPLYVFRLASIFGPRNLTGPIPTFYKRIAADEVCTVVENVTRDFIFINDVVNYVVKRIEGDQFGTYDVGSGIETPIAAIPEMIGRALGTAPSIGFIPKPENDVSQYDMHPDSPEELDTRLEDAIQETVDWYRERGTFDTYTHLKIGATNAA